MAELTPTDTSDATTSACCGADEQATCCETAKKAECCTPETSSCACSAANHTQPAEAVREQVRERYAAAALAAPSGGCGCGPVVSVMDQRGHEVFGAALYDQQTAQEATGALAASLGCGVPTAVAELREGETVLDLGSGAGADVLISARRVGPSGRAIGLDMTDEMLDLARRSAQRAGIGNAEFRKGYLEAIPLPDASVDVVISNCVLNLAGDKPQALRESVRVLRPGGRFAISDVIADPDMDAATRADMRRWTGCIAGALTRVELASTLTAVGFEGVEIKETHRVHEHATAAVIRARKACGPQ